MFLVKNCNTYYLPWHTSKGLLHGIHWFVNSDRIILILNNLNGFQESHIQNVEVATISRLKNHSNIVLSNLHKLRIQNFNMTRTIILLDDCRLLSSPWLISRPLWFNCCSTFAMRILKNFSVLTTTGFVPKMSRTWFLLILRASLVMNGQTLIFLLNQPFLYVLQRTRAIAHKTSPPWQVT